MAFDYMNFVDYVAEGTRR